MHKSSLTSTSDVARPPLGGGYEWIRVHKKFGRRVNLEESFDFSQWLSASYGSCECRGGVINRRDTHTSISAAPA
jgi:hypothetical protein